MAMANSDKKLAQNPKKYRSQAKNETEAECEKSANVLMNHGFFILLLNMVLGLLPITISGNQIQHQRCSISTIYSIVLMLAMGFLSIAFLQVSTETFGTTIAGDGVAYTVARLIQTCAHVVGFIFLTLRGHWVATRLPKIWNSVITAFQMAVVDIHGKSWRKARRLKRFCIRSCIIYAAILIGFSFSKTLDSMEDVLKSLGKILLIQDKVYAIGLYIGFMIWDLVSLGHILVSMLVNFFLIVIVLCIQSANGQLKDAIEISNKIARGQEGQGQSQSDDGATPSLGLGPATREAEAEIHLTKEFARVTKIYTICELAANQMSSIFGISLIVEVLILFGNTVVNLFFIIQMALEKQKAPDYYDYFELSASCFYNFFFLFGVSCCVSEMINESQMPLFLTEGLQYNYNSPRIREKIQSFKIDIASTRITLSATDYFQLDKRLISALVGAVTTFLIVMIQFEQQDFA